MKNLLDKLFRRLETKSQEDEERDRFSLEVRKQLLQLKEKGLSIPIFTL